MKNNEIIIIEKKNCKDIPGLNFNIKRKSYIVDKTINGQRFYAGFKNF